MDLFFEIHQGLPREAPGSDASTARALSMVQLLPERPRILDIGCGTGMQTLTLARLTGGEVTAVDNHQPFLDELQRRAATAGLSESIKTLNCSMSELDLERESFNLIWSEGAIYIIGFAEGLKAWRRLLKPGGALVVSELSWLVTEPPQEVKDFWQQAYPHMKGIDQNFRFIEETGYIPLGSFTLPESDWWENYYDPLSERLSILHQKHSNDSSSVQDLEEARKEIILFRAYPHAYGYVFYIMMKPLG